MSEIFCSVKAGVNTCGICLQQAYFSTSFPQKPHQTLPTMELFVCGHGICASCMKEMERRGPFKCPYCRSGGIQIINFEHAVSLSLQARGLMHTNEKIPSRTKEINTFSEFMEEQENSQHMILNTKNRFMVLYKQIIKNKQMRQQKAEAQALKDKEIALKKEQKRMRECSRKNAVCSVCNKDTFTSMKQLEQHMNAKHATKSKQRLKIKH